MSSPLSAFTAIPNPQMPAFLGAQSFIMMYQAGEGWQYGKRRISALSNEEFNKLDIKSLMERQAMELKGAIPIIERSMNNMTRMVPMIIEQYGDFIREAIKAMPQFFQNITGGGGEFKNIPTTTPQGNLPPEMASFLHYFKTLSDATKADVLPRDFVPEGVGTSKAESGGFGMVHAKMGHPGHKHQGTPPVPTQRETGIIPTAGKKKAGQSQKLERLRLVKAIADTNIQLKQQARFPRRVENIEDALAKLQTKLMILLQRYRF